MELPSKILQQIAHNTRPKIEEHMLIFMDKSTHEEHLSQPLQSNKKHFEIGGTFSTGYNEIFNVTDKNNKFYFRKSNNDDDFSKIINSQGAYEIESSNNEIKRIIIEGGQFTEADYPFTIKPNFLTLGSIIEISSNGSLIALTPNDSIRDLLGFKTKVIHEDYNLSDYQLI